MPSLLHQIRRGMGHTISGVTLAFPVPIGTPIGYKSINASTGEKTFGLANGAAAFAALFASGGLVVPKGFMTRDSRGFPGLNDTELAFGFGLETPFFAGTDGSIEPGDDIEVEGNTYILTAGTAVWPDNTTTNLSAAISANALSSASAPGTELCFANGLFAAAASGDYVSHLLEAIMTPVVSASNLRIFVTATTGYRKP